MRRPTKIALCGVLFLLIATPPEAFAQGNRRGRRSGNRGQSGALFGGRRKRKRAIVAPVTPATPPPPAVPVTTPSGASLAADEKRFRDLLGQLDASIQAADERREQALQQVQALGFALPEGVEPGTVEWRTLQRPIFETADYDGSGWISFREARESLEMDRLEFAQYDNDRDGRIGPREFIARYDELVAKTGAFRLPKPKSSDSATAPRSPEQLRAAFDTDGDGSLEAEELDRLLAEYRRASVDSATLIETLDSNRSGGLDGVELFQLSRLISVTFVLPDGDTIKRPRQKSVEELFGQVVARSGDFGPAQGPPLIPGPVPHFRRLDLDGDGFVTIEELRDLQGAWSTGTRVGAVLATLDLDEDGRLSEREFLTSLSTARK